AAIKVRRLCSFKYRLSKLSGQHIIICFRHARRTGCGGWREVWRVVNHALRPRRAGSASKHRAASHLGVKNGESRFTRAPSFDPSGEGSGGDHAQAQAGTRGPGTPVASRSNPAGTEGITRMAVP